jgi:hypothetical protein
MTFTIQPAKAEAEVVYGYGARLLRAVTALVSGCLLVPLLLLSLLHFNIPAESRGYANPDFWLAVMAGGILAAVISVSFKRRIPLWFTALLAPMAVTCTVALWLFFSIFNIAA